MKSESEWEATVSELYSLTRHSKCTQTEFFGLRQKYILTELLRTSPKGKRWYNQYEKGFVFGLMRSEYNRMFREHLEFCYVTEHGVIYSTNKESSHPTTEAWYTAELGVDLAKLPSGHYWKNSDKKYA